jgi:hypothetical protein
MEIIRKPAVADAFYPADPEILGQMIDEYLQNCVKPQIEGEIKAIIVPHAGYVYSGIVAAAGYNLIKNSKAKKVLLIGPAHYVLFKGAAVPESNIWQMPFGNVQVSKLPTSELIIEDEAAFSQEHSLEVQVPFLQTVMEDFELYPLCLGEVNPEALANEIKSFAERDDVLIVVSSDLSHFYTYTEANDLDKRANEFIPKLDIVGARNVEACGIKGIMTLLHLAKMLGLKGHFIDYKNSGDTSGEKSRVVGYGCYAFTK